MAKSYVLETIAALTLIALQSSGGSSVVTSRIANGEEAEPGEFPFLVSLTYDDEHICAGFVYDTQHVVTAASCVYGKAVDTSFGVVVGQNNLISTDPDEKRYDISSIVIYDGYDNVSKVHDLALIKIRGIFDFGPYVSIGYYDEQDETSNKAVIMGWGYYNEGGPLSLRLLKGTVTLILGCEVYGDDEYQRNYMICAGDSGIDTAQPCLYDEGSPLLQGSTIIGIMSKNKGCQYTQDFPPSIYTRLSAYFVWFERVVGAQPVLP